MERLAVLAICSGSVAASFAGMLAILNLADHQAKTPLLVPGSSAVEAPAVTVPAPRPADRLAHLRSKMTALMTPSDLDLRPSQPPEAEAEDAESPDAWSAETRLEAPMPAGKEPRISVPQHPQTPLAKPDAPRTYSLSERLAEISPGASSRLAAKFESAKVAWPPADMALVAIKDEKILELHARPAGGAWKLVHRYPVLAASGVSGPKLKQGDKQVPEGVYGISFLNPNSRYHVSLRVNYPNTFDREMAAKDGRKDLGGDIMIHGKALSVGCLAVGDEAAEELFVLAAQVGLGNVKLVIAPTDFRRNGIPEIDKAQPVWVPKLYTEVASAMSEFKAPRSTGLLSFFGN